MMGAAIFTRGSTAAVNQLMATPPDRPVIPIHAAVHFGTRFQVVDGAHGVPDFRPGRRVAARIPVVHLRPVDSSGARRRSRQFEWDRGGTLRSRSSRTKFHA